MPEIVTGHTLHRPVDGAYLLVTVDIDPWWRAMPGQAVRTVIAQRLARYAAGLTAAGFGVATWGRTEQPEVLLVACDQAAADLQAPALRAHLDAYNPPALRSPAARGAHLKSGSSARSNRAGGTPVNTLDGKDPDDVSC